MNDFDIEITCHNCKSKNVSITAVEKYEGDIILAFVCNGCETTETWGVLDEIDE